MSQKVFAQYDSFDNLNAPPAFLPEDYVLSLGKVTIVFAFLENQLLVAIAHLLPTDDDEVEMILAEMSFKNRVNLLASLMRHRIDDTEFNFGGFDPQKTISELVSICTKAEELRNKVVHSQWELEPTTQKVRRRKTTSKATPGLRFQYEYFEVEELYKIVNFVGYVTKCIGDVFNHFQNLRSNC